MHVSKQQNTFTIPELAELWQVTVQWIRQRINKPGGLPARNLSPGSSRPTYRIDAADATAFWDSLVPKVDAAKEVKHAKQAKQAAISDVDFEDFI